MLYITINLVLQYHKILHMFNLKCLVALSLLPLISQGAEKRFHIPQTQENSSVSFYVKRLLGYTQECGYLNHTSN